MHTSERKKCFKLIPYDSLISILWTGCLRAMLFALTWFLLTDGVMDSWLIGGPVVLLATIASIVLLPPFSWSFIGIMRIVPVFLWRSLYAGIDVARRALHPRLPISPGLYQYRWRLPPGVPQIFMANMVSLLPGTLSAELADEYLCVHVLDQTGDFISELSIIEDYVARLFALNLIADRS
ncbi:MAG: Na+/H+ antiporter subunit E [gamma proteobacterium symbiont of Bathyaustriella thionipta]|nr:Na+/H+ antiporter subunit E [gamma proteobacterium symbiont of Bathyaustriella thionipta]MCU7948837.1 Na+/H+ antiporter subunit E [gamma proteobacterium symbiont of Bathyaustriella thionipta]MCU7954352.1 Na+/H+ antiporter subunit E [gamma proteobacterium symbiont of Bathyaustriella thionipta]MCU7955295.1 Na+/H+ antiporter subunit E [gamma proteobacterium symbiont of Bathyaustriella thionipta]MCU7967124.1 Na+/H+ antiporter subunit E [gamma proteobacterium symbiont of Bathyaustriella thionipta